MLAALGTSALFLISYLVIIISRPLPSPARGYSGVFTILISQLSWPCPRAVSDTVARALRSRFDRHKRIARWTLPLWFYVSVTGVIVYWMLYRM